MPNKKNIALVAGGYSGEYAISIQTAITIENNIDKEKYNLYKIIIERESWYYIQADGTKIDVERKDFTLSLSNEKIVFDAVFIAVHGTPGEDGKLQGYFEMLGLPFTSCGAIVSGLTFNKIFCNQVIANRGVVNVSKSMHIVKGNNFSADTILEKVNLPVFVKPAEGGSSLATTKVKTKEELMPAIDAVFAFDSQAMVEEFIKGREFSMGVYKVKNQIHALPITEIVSTKEFFDYEAKYTPGMSNEITPANIEPKLAHQITIAGKEIFVILNCKGVCRVDFIVEEKTNAIYFLEINTIPGQSENSIVPQQVRAAGMTLMGFYSSLLEECFL
jgi:D-alanine-D-alanine ligase